MKEFTNESASELLTQLMDGELEPAKESGVYDALSSSAELQDEHKMHLAVREAIKHDTEAFTPPAVAVSSLFNKLGYAPPPPAITTGVVRRSPVLMSMFRKAAVPVILLLAGSYGAYTLFNDSTSDENIASVAKPDTKSVVFQNQIIPPPSDLSTFLSDSEKSVSNLNNTPKIPVITSVYSSNSSLANSSIDNDQKIVSTNSVNLQPEIRSEESNVILASSSSIVQIPTRFDLVASNSVSMGALSPSINDVLGSKDLGLTVYAKGLTNFDSELGSPFSNINGRISNFSIGVTFSRESNLSGGIEFGIQPYSVLVSNLEDESALINQLRAVSWFAPTGKYSVKEIGIYNIVPFVQGSVGFADFGQYMFRYSLGIEFNPFGSGIGFIAGYENSLLWYTINSKQQSTNSDGIYMGMKISF